MTTENCPWCDADPMSKIANHWKCGSSTNGVVNIQTELCRANCRIRELKQRCEKLEAACKHALLCINEPDMMSGLCPEILEDALDNPTDEEVKP